MIFLSSGNKVRDLLQEVNDYGKETDCLFGMRV